ncbi:MAG: signal peptidase I [Actinobacteria bacterium]|nr:signal peptidase I [Actinomycetota bacterium]
MADQTDLGPALPEPADQRPTGGRHARRPEPGPEARPDVDASAGHGSFWKELPILLLVAFGLAFLIKTFVVQAFYIPSGSMEQTLQVGDRVLVNKVVYHLRPIERGDIVVFNGVDSFTPEVTIVEPDSPVAKVVNWFGRTFGFAPPDERDFVKRVIGVGGDRVACCDAQGRITVNGIPLDEQDYLFPGNVPSQDSFDVVVPEGKLWVMGDHRAASSDSRAHMGDPGGGFVPEDRVIGRAFAVLWPFSDAQFLEIPPGFAVIDEKG